MRLTNFIENGIWLKGNLHSHSTNSDGDLPPEQVINAYKNRGYHFLALTDHNIFTSYNHYNDENFVMIAGTELTCQLNDDKCMHLNVFCKTSEYEFSQNQTFIINTPKKTIDFISKYKQNNIIMLNHPYWSLLEWEEVINLDGVYCMEVFNYASEWLDCVGEASKFWDTMLRKGKKMWGLATDDNHNGYTHIQGWPFNLIQMDSFGGYIVVKAKELTYSSIMSAVETGSFYASSGPEIFDFYIESNEAVVRCSPCQRIIFSGDRRYFQRQLGEHLTEHQIILKGTEKFVRVQCIDKYGKIAYANPIFL